MMAVASSRRIEVLAQPKPLPPGFTEDRRSVYWIDRTPFIPGEDGTTSFVLTPRQEYLCNAKRTHPLYKGDRPSPMWTVSKAARQTQPSQHLAVLSMPRDTHRDYMYERNVYTKITSAAKTAEASQRLEVLAKPKPHKIWSSNPDMYEMGEFFDSIRPISKAATGSQSCSARVEQLAEAKEPHNSFQGERPVQWSVPESTKSAVATIRLQQLARPKSGRLASDDYDPYRVTAAARSARAAPRVVELSAPIPRKMRQKKAV